MAGELRDFFCATAPGFEERAGAVVAITEDDLKDTAKRRHLESYKASMQQWMTYDERSELGGGDRHKLISFAKALNASENGFPDGASLEKAITKLRKELKFQPSKSQLGAILKELLESEVIERIHPDLEGLLIKRVVRSASGVSVITVLTSPGKFSCPHDCFYCPNEPGQPRSYLSTEPAVLRANQCAWDPAVQFWDRALTLRKNGHVVDKVEVLVLGGTWSGYTESYQEEFCRDLFYAANEFGTLFDLLEKMDTSICKSSEGATANLCATTSTTGAETCATENFLAKKMSASPILAVREKLRPRGKLEDEQTINETSECKMIGLTLETRPDYIDLHEIRRLRRYGCTRVQLGVQHTHDEILSHINRGCRTDQVKRALRLLKDSGYKVDIHLMPDLPSSSLQADEQMFDEVLRDSDLQADQWKIYPCEVTPFSTIADWYKCGTFVPYTEAPGGEEALLNLILRVKRSVHPWIRLNRVVRDIPNPSIIAGNSRTNLRQMLGDRARDQGWQCACMRCREVRLDSVCKSEDAQLVIRKYEASSSWEYFISFESPGHEKLFGFLRLRLPEAYNTRAPYESISCRCALVRELHVYGMLVSTKEKKVPGDSRRQHSGFGTRLLAAAEAISVCKGYDRVAIIAGVGTRGYYRKFGYKLRDTFMLKDLATNEAKGDALIRYLDFGLPPKLEMMHVDLGNTRSVTMPLPEAQIVAKSSSKTKPSPPTISDSVTRHDMIEILSIPHPEACKQQEGNEQQVWMHPILSRLRSQVRNSSRTSMTTAITVAAIAMGAIWYIKHRRR